MESPFPIFPAKLREPEPAAYLIRERLFERLDAANAPLIVVHADAGYGKTTLVASYLRERARTALWNHLGTTDRVWGSLVAHIRHGVAGAHPSALASGADPLDAMNDPQLTGATLAALLGRIRDPLALVLEDYHLLEESSEIHRVVRAMIEHLPAGVQVFLLSRTRPPLPLSRLALGGRALVLTKADLAFNFEETAALFARTYERYLTDEQLDLITRRIEGWVVGLRLTQEALKLTPREDRAHFWSSFAESTELFDYLSEEVLASLPPNTLQFLFQTSIFTVLQPQLIEDFLPGCAAAATLETLARENLFTTALGSAGALYRYHNLFRRLLFRKLVETVGDEGVRKLHAHAADLYARRDEFDFAIGHNLAAREFQRVTRLLEQVVDRHRPDVILRLMEGWLERAFPDLEGTCGVVLRALLPLSVYELILPGLRQVAEGCAPNVDPITQAHAQQRLGTYLYYRGRLDECVPWLHRSRDTFRAAGHLTPASVCCTLLGLALVYQGTPEAAEERATEALALAGSEPSFAKMNALWLKAELALALGRFREAEDSARALLATDIHFHIGAQPACDTLAMALLYQGRLAEAKAACDESTTSSSQLELPRSVGLSQMRLAKVLHASGCYADARVAAQTAVVNMDGFDFLQAMAMLIRADLAAAAGEPDAAALWTETRAFWENRGYHMHTAYVEMMAPTLLSSATDPAPPGATMPIPHSPFASVDNGSRPSLTHAIAASPNDVRVVIGTLGTLHLSVDGRDLAPNRWGRAPSLRLFFYLLLRRNRIVHRDEILEALWPEDDPVASAKRLKSALHVLRRELAPLSDIVDRQGQTYCLRLPTLTDLDLDRYLALSTDGLAQENRATLREASSHYRGDFLAEYPYEEFLAGERTRVRGIHYRVVMRLAGISGTEGDLDGALALYREAQRLDPLLEEPARRIIEIFLAQGETRAAAEVYRRLRTDLDQELGLEPSEELRSLYQQAIAPTQQVT